MNPIVIDSRGEDETVEAINKALPDVPTVQRFLDCGDMLWFAEGFNCVLGLERKRADDLLNSLPPSDRLESQLGRMVEKYEFPVLLIQGDVERQLDHLKRMDVECRWTADGIDDYLLSWQLAGVSLVRCTMGGLGERVRLLYNWSQRSDHLRRRRKRQLLWTGPSTGRAESLSALVPGLGLTRAQLLAEHSMAALCAMEWKAWKDLTIPGLGVTMKKKVYEALHTEEQ